MTQDSRPKYPDITVQLSGEDGNAFVIIARVRNAMKRHPEARRDIAKFTNEAMAGDYSNVIYTATQYVEVL